MEYSLTIRLIAEVMATAMLVIIGNGAVANVDLVGTKGGEGAGAHGWALIAMGYGFAVMLPAMIFGGISGNHINPAFTIGLAVSGYFPWVDVVPYIFAQIIGAMLGQLVVVAMYKPYYDQTTNVNHVFGTFSTANAANSKLNGFIGEFVGSFILFFAAIAITKGVLFTGANAAPGLAHVALGFLVWALVIAIGGPTGPALNPARDLGPRIIHQLLPLKHKGSSNWDYAWVPVVAPILAAIAAVATFSALYDITR